MEFELGFGGLGPYINQLLSLMSFCPYTQLKSPGHQLPTAPQVTLLLPLCPHRVSSLQQLPGSGEEQKIELLRFQELGELGESWLGSVLVFCDFLQDSKWKW